jgi:hypothetical protein
MGKSSILRSQGPNMPQSLIPLAVSSAIFVCTFAAALLGMALRRRLPDDHLSEDSKDVIQLIMGLIATMAALVLGLLIASANGSYQTESDEVQRASASIVELGALLAHYGPEASDAHKRLHQAVTAAATKIWRKDPSKPKEPGPAGVPAEGSNFYESIARLSPSTEAQRFIQKRALEIGSSLRQTRALLAEQTASSLPWPFVAVLVVWISMLFLGFGLFARANMTVIAAFVTGALSVASAIFLILELNDPFGGLMSISDAPLRNALATISP